MRRQRRRAVREAASLLECMCTVTLFRRSPDHIPMSSDSHSFLESPNVPRLPLYWFIGYLYDNDASTSQSDEVGILTTRNHRLRGKRFIFVHSVLYRPSCPPSLLYCMYQGLVFPEVQRPEREADRSPSSSKVKNAWSYTSIRLHVIMFN
jgi:hypothetical protein